VLTLVLALHNHQPVGNFDQVFRQAVDECYRPLLDELARFPRLKLALHHSGPLLDWLDRHEPGYLADVVALARGGQFEILGGGYDEPILAAIPPEDARGQICAMQDYWLEKAGLRPAGAWLAERVWDPSLVPTLAACGVDFTFIDDTLFHQAGAPPGPISGRYRTERAGAGLDLFPIDRELRYRIPFQPVAELATYLRELAERDSTLTYADDGEKFGLWPGTREWVFERRWLRDFCTMLDEGRELFATAHPSQIARQSAPADRVYPPAGAYEEMQAWALPTEARRALVAATEAARARAPGAVAFLRGAVWEGFLAKYPEARQMHERMLGVSRRLARARSRGATASQLDQARRALYRAQCNCAYWHGLFGGLYLGHLRHAVYANLLEAEQWLDASPLSSPGDAETYGEGEEVLRLSSAALAAFVAPGFGGSIVELDDKPRRFNLVNTLARWEEAYHRRDESTHPEEPLPERRDGMSPLVFDRRRRAAFLDHVWASDAAFEELLRGGPRCLAAPADAPFAVVDHRPDRVELQWEGRIEGRPARLRKRYALDGDGSSLVVRLGWEILSGEPLRARLASEINFTVLAGAAPDRFARIEGRREPTMTAASTEGVRSAAAIDSAFGFEMSVDCLAAPAPPSLWRFPVETWTRSEQQVVRAYQGTAWYWVFDAELRAGATPTAIELQLRVSAAPSTDGE
jgi:4-alpha-glucanotransferase